MEVRSTSKSLKFELETKIRELKLLQDVNNLLYSGADIEDVYQTIVKGLTSIFHYNISAIYLLDETGNRLVCEGNDAKSSTIKKIEKLTGVSPFKYSFPLIKGGIMAEVVGKKKSIITKDTSEVVKSHTNDNKIRSAAGIIAKASGAKWGMGVPIISDDKAIGVIGVGSSEELGDEDVSRLANFGIQVGIAIEKSRMITNLKENEERFRSLAESSNDAIISINSKGRVIYWNEKARDLFGYQPEEMIGKPLESIIPKVFHEGHKKGVKRASLEGGSRIIGKAVEMSALKKDGTQFPIELSVAEWRTKDDLFFTGNIRDITIRNQTDKALREAEELYRTVFENSPAAITLTDKEERIISCNKTTADILGMDIDDLYFRPVKSLYPEEEWKKIRSYNLREKGLKAHLETKLIDKKGKLVDVDVSLSVLKDNNGEVTGSIGIIRDITDKRKVQLAIESSYNRITTVLESLDAIVYVADMETYEVLYANKEVGKAFGSIIGKTCWKVLQSGQKGPCDFCSNDKLLDKNGRPKGVYVWEFQNTVNNRWYEIHDKAIEWVDGRIVRLEIATDITLRKKVEDAIQERTTLAALNADIGSALVTGATIPAMLQECSEALVHYLNVAFARIWTLNDPGDILELKASAGMYTHLDGGHNEVPIGKYKIGRIAQDRRPHQTNKVIGDPQIHDQNWARKEKMVSFAGHPLIIEGRVVGVMAMFSQNPIQKVTLRALANVADEIALGIERKKVEEQLHKYNEELEDKVDERTLEIRKQKELMENITEGIEEGILLLDKDLKILWANKKVKELTGCNSNELMGKHCYEVTHNQSSKCQPPMDLCPIDEILSTGKPASEIHRHYTKKGGTQFVEVTAYPVKSRGEITGYVHLSRDISEKMKFEEELNRLKVFNENIVQTMEEGILIEDDEGFITFTNPRMEMLIGASKEKIIGTNCLSLFASGYEKIWQEQSNLLKKGEKTRFEAALKKGQDNLDVMVSATPIMESDLYVGNLKVFVDITDRKKAEEKLRDKALKYKIERGKSYLIKESKFDKGGDVISDLVQAGYDGLIITRTPPAEMAEDFHESVELIWLSEKEKGKSVIPPQLEIIKKRIEDFLSRNSVVLLDRLDYLIVQKGFNAVLKLLHELSESVYISNSIILVIVDPGTISSQEMSLLEKEFRSIESKRHVNLEKDLLDILLYVRGENLEGRFPAHKDVERNFGITRPTAIKRMKVLKGKGLLIEKKKGRFKTLELSEKGKEIL